MFPTIQFSFLMSFFQYDVLSTRVLHLRNAPSVHDVYIAIQRCIGGPDKHIPPASNCLGGVLWLLRISRCRISTRSDRTEAASASARIAEQHDRGGGNAVSFASCSSSTIPTLHQSHCNKKSQQNKHTQSLQCNMMISLQSVNKLIAMGHERKVANALRRCWDTALPRKRC